MLAIVALLVGASSASAATKVVNFDDHPAGTTVTNQYEAEGVTFVETEALLPVIRSAPAGQAHSGSQIADFTTCPLCGEGFVEPRARGVLTTTATAVGMYVGELSGEFSRPATIQLTAYDGSDKVLAQTLPTEIIQGTGFATHLEVKSATPITYFVVDDTSGAGDDGLPIGMDDLTLTTPDEPQPPDFTLGQSNSVLDALQGQTAQDTLKVTRINGSTGNITMSVSGLPAGMTGSFSPNPLTGTETTTTLTVTAAQGAAASTSYSNAKITATPTPTAGSIAHSVEAAARISSNCANTVTFQYVDLRSPGCLIKQGTSQYVALNTEVHIDGLVLKPLDGDHVLTIDTTAKTIKSDLGATYSVSVIGSPDTPFYYGPIDWNFKTEVTTPVPLDKDPVGKPKKLEGIDISGNPFFQGIPLTGISVVVTSSAKAIVTPTLKLDFFPFNYFGALTVNTAFITDNEHGASFNSLEIKASKLNVLALELKDVDLKYQETGTWSGSASVVLNFADKLTVGAGFGIKQGKFAFLKGSVGNLNTAIGEGIFLQGLGFEFAVNPTTLKGQIELSAGPQIAGKTALTMDGGVTAVLADPWVVEVDGDAKVVKQELASAFVRFNSIGLFEFGGHVHWSLDAIYVDGTVGGWVAGLHNFDVEGGVKGCISVPLLPDPCAGAKVLASNLGIAACVEALGEGVGVGSHWGEDFDAFTGCDLSPWRPTEPTGTGARVATASQRLTVPRGQSEVAWSIDGQGGVAPDVTVVGPHHETVSVSQTAPYVNNNTFLAVETENGRTYVVLRHPTAGTWTVSATGATPITRIRQALGLPKPSVKASVGGHGRARVLHWKIKRIPGQVVSFAEIGSNVRSVISSTSKAGGSIRFRPAEGAAGKRKIEAIVEQNGRPRTTLIVASYVAPGMLKPGAPRALKLTRKGTKIVATFKPHPTGFRHAVYIQLTDGRRLLQILSAKTHTATFAGIATSVGAKVTVTGITAGNSKGPSAHASIRGKPEPKPKPKKKKKRKSGH